VSSFGQQVSEAIVVGTVVDSSQAALQGATVSLKHVATNSTIQVRTDDRGQYRTPPVRLGEYTISIEADGFKRFNQSGVVLNIGDTREVDAVLQVGQVSETINVEASAPLLQTSDSTVGTVITNQMIEELPLNGRDYLQLASLSSGTLPGGQGVSIGGQAGTQAAFLLDGQDNNNQEILTSHSGQKEIVKPSIDSIQEFKVVTNGYSAEYGRSSSGVVSVALKSGSNAVHGTAYDFVRNQVFDATNDLFAPTATKPPFKQNQFGASAGGPVVRNKTFFFADFEVGIFRQSSQSVSTLPTIAQRDGQFASSIYDPNSYNPATNTRTLFPGNLIPATREDAIALKILAFYPLPQNAATTRNYAYTGPQNSDPRRWDLRIDQILSDKQNLYFRYSTQIQDSAATSSLPPDPVLGFYNGGGANKSTSESYLLVHNKVWSPTLISSIHLGWNYLYWHNWLGDQKLYGNYIGIPGVGQSDPGFSSIAITGLPSLGVSNVPNTDGSQDRQISGDLTWNKRSHNIKFGVQAYWLQTNFFSSQQNSGIFSFNGQFTRNTANLSGGSALADFLLGDAYSASLSNYAYLRFRIPEQHLFIQDDWKVSRHLTLNIGLRYELAPPAVEKQNKIANFDIDTNPASPQLVLAGSEGSSRADRALQGVDYHQFAPRFGFAYSLPDNRTVLRGGYGIFYSNVQTQGGMQSMEINPPNHIRVNLTTDPDSPSIFLSQGFPSGALTFANAQSVELVSYQRSATPATAQEWNFDVQRQLPGSILLETGYYANKFDNAWWQLDGNPAPPGPGNINPRRLYPTAAIPGTPYTITLADVLRVAKTGYSDYNALQAKVEKRFSKGLTFLASYAWSKTIGIGDSNDVQNPQDISAERAVSSNNRAQYFVGSTVYQLPFGKGKQFGAHWNRFTDAVLGGWNLSPIVTLVSGQPLNLSVNGTPSNSGQADRPNVVGNWHLANPTINEWFNTAAFVANAPYTYGNAGRNILVGPGAATLNVGIHKTFAFTERVKAQLRLESFNATNHPNLGNPNTQVGNVNFGQISSVGTPRNNQIALKILF
jgi:hypothetical protein